MGIVGPGEHVGAARGAKLEAAAAKLSGRVEGYRDRRLAKIVGDAVAMDRRARARRRWEAETGFVAREMKPGSGISAEGRELLEAFGVAAAERKAAALELEAGDRALFDLVRFGPWGRR